MNENICKRASSVSYWDGYARWYDQWARHNRYHDGIIELLTSIVAPGWKVLDIGAGNGVLSLPLCDIGCDVTAVEPSIAMRDLFYKEAFSKDISWINVDDRKWEEIPSYSFRNFDLIMACNSLHLTGIGLTPALRKIFAANPKNVLLVTEYLPGIKINTRYSDYKIMFAKSYQTESSFAYHNMNEIREHWTFSKDSGLSSGEFEEIKGRLVIENGHIWLKDRADVSIYWWSRDENF